MKLVKLTDRNLSLHANKRKRSGMRNVVYDRQYTMRCSKKELYSNHGDTIESTRTFGQYKKTQKSRRRVGHWALNIRRINLRTWNLGPCATSNFGKAHYLTCEIGAIDDVDCFVTPSHWAESFCSA